MKLASVQVLAWMTVGTSFAFANSLPANSLTTDDVVTRMLEAEEKKAAATQCYTGTRRYHIRNDRFGQQAEMLVEVIAKPGGKQFRVLSSSGAESMHRRVFDKLLKGETEASREQASNRIDRTNYDFALAGQETLRGRRTYVLELRPKEKKKYLVEGKIWVDAQDFQVVRLEGRPAASLSFWVGRPQLTFDYDKVDGHWMTTRNRTFAKSRLMGATELTIEFQRYDLGGKPKANYASGSPVSPSTLARD
jgi:hypothetical protein